MGDKRRIAILGGGVGAMAAAVELTSKASWQDEYEITVYQLGWRLGGKGASGRNRARGMRIEEHGLHFWMGFYENAFRMIQGAYAGCVDNGLTPGSPFQSWEDAFSRQDLTTVMENTPEGWKPWSIVFPRNPFMPGDPALFERREHPPPPWELAVKLLDWLVDEVGDLPHLMREVEEDVEKDIPEWIQKEMDALGGIVHKVEEAVEGLGKRIFRAVEDVFGDGGPAPVRRTHLHVARDVAKRMPSDPAEHSETGLKAVVHLVERFLEKTVKKAEAELEENDTVRRVAVLADLGIAVLKGMVKDGVVTHGFEAIDDVDFIDWLEKHGAHHANASFVRAGYDSTFAFERGDSKAPNLAAGTALLGVLRMMLTYKGSVYWRMNSGMGDTIFSPIYLLLKHRGVRFEFFQRVTHIGLSPGHDTVDSIDIDVQATLKNPEEGYQPLVDERGRPYQEGLPCWPSDPLYDQLKQGDELASVDLESWYTEWKPVGHRTLARGKDFDDVLLGISIGAFPHICKELGDANEAWREMVANVQTVQTQAAQLWLKKTSVELGWKADASKSSHRPCLTAYAEPLDTWADMGQLLPRESGDAAAGVKQITYFCGAMQQVDHIPPPFTDPEFPRQQYDQVLDTAMRFVGTRMGPILPKSVDASGEFDWNLLVDEVGDAKGPDRLKSQYLRANIDPTERYVLSVAGTNKYRLDPGSSGFENLYLAGDWTQNVLNVGCVEAAVISGMWASRAICGFPKHIHGLFMHEDDETSR